MFRDAEELYVQGVKMNETRYRFSSEVSNVCILSVAHDDLLGIAKIYLPINDAE